MNIFLGPRALPFTSMILMIIRAMGVEGKRRERRPADNGTKENVTLGRASLTEGYAFASIYTWRVHVLRLSTCTDTPNHGHPRELPHRLSTEFPVAFRKIFYRRL